MENNHELSNPVALCESTPSGDFDREFVKAKEAVDNSQAGPLAKYRLWRKQASTLAVLHAEKMDIIAAVGKTAINAQGRQQIATIKTWHEQALTRIRADYITIMRDCRLRVEMSQLEFMTEAGERIAKFMDQLSAKAMPPAFAERIKASAENTFHKLFDDLEQLTQQLANQAKA